MFDTKRPCSSKSRQKNRYTRQELVNLLEKMKIPIPNKSLTIDAMCALLQKKSGSVTPSIEKPSNVPIKCQIEKIPPCFPGTKKRRYKKSELIEAWKKGGCETFWKKASPKTVKEYCEAFTSIMSHSTPESIGFSIPSLWKTVFGKIVEKYKTIVSKPGWIHDRFLYINVKSIVFPSKTKPSVKMNMLRKISKTYGPVTTMQVILRPLCTASYGFDAKEINLPHSFTRDRHFLFNRNMTNTVETHLEHWLGLQMDYIYKTLTWEQQLIVLTYTYGGDQMLNKYLLGTTDPLAIVPESDVKTPDSLYSRYRDLYVMPLVLFLYQDLQASPTWQSFVERVLHTKDTSLFKKSIVTSLKTFFRSRQKSLEDVYITLFRFLVRSRGDLPIAVFQRWLDKYAHNLNTIILHAPRPSFSFYAYRGIKNNDYVHIGNVKKYVFVQKSFLSTSLNLCEALSFKNKTDSCCIHQIFIPKNTPCLFMGLTYFSEAEVLFPYGSSLYPVTTEYVAKNVPVQVQDFTLV